MIVDGSRCRSLNSVDSVLGSWAA